MTVAVAVSTVAVVVRQLIRGNAIAHVVFVPWFDNKHRKEWPGRSVLTDVTRLAYRVSCLIGYGNSERIWWMKVLQQSLGVNPEQGSQDTS